MTVGIGCEQRSQLGLGRIVLGGLFLEFDDFRFHVGRVGHQGQHAQRSEAIADVVAHFDHEPGRYITDAHHVIEAILDLRHAQDTDHRDCDQQYQNQCETEGQTGADLHVVQIHSCFPCNLLIETRPVEIASRDTPYDAQVKAMFLIVFSYFLKDK
jgi:hypothetical protein